MNRPRISSDGTTYTFRLRSGFRFSDGTPSERVRSPARSTALLAPEMNSPGVHYARRHRRRRARVGRARRRRASGVDASGNTLVVRLDATGARLSASNGDRRSSAQCHRHLPIDPEGRGAFPAAGPYFVTEYRRGERAVLQQNRTTGASGRTTSTASTSTFASRRRKKCCGESSAAMPTGDTRSTGIYFDPALGLVEKYGINRSHSSSSAVSPCGCSRSTRHGRCSATTRASAKPSTSRSSGGRS